MKGLLLVLSTVVSVFLFSGIIFGWPALNSMLISEGVFYSSLCGDEPQPCDAQKTALNRAFTYASTALSLVSLPAGALIDRYGPLAGGSIVGVLNILGLIGICVCQVVGSVEFDVFLGSTVLLAVGGSITMFTGYALPFLFPSHATLLIELISSLFDGSCIILPLMRLAYEAGIPFEAQMSALKTRSAPHPPPRAIRRLRACPPQSAASSACAQDEVFPWMFRSGSTRRSSQSGGDTASQSFFALDQSNETSPHFAAY